MILIGASGHAKVILDILLNMGVTVDHLVDSNMATTELSGFPVVHESAYLPEPAHEVIISIGANRVRQKIATKLKVQFATAVHPSAIVAQNSIIGKGTVIMAGAMINPSTRIGAHCIINTAASVDHDCNIADFVHISPNVTLCGTVNVGEGTHVGAGATIIPNINIGKWVTVGAGAVIIDDVPDNAVIVGNPGRIIRYND